ncbi:MAG: zinc-binding dehydrogenase [Patescibacteria group bacterium]|jgi:threonine 3-dehydrogenase|nr:zinc-binding dehydrogenase [Patescibacteria group bacterium]
MKALIKIHPTNPPEWYVGLNLVDKPEPAVTPSRPVKLKIISTGVCGTDVGIYQGKDSLAYTMAKNTGTETILGHEFCGQIFEIHPTAKIEVVNLLLRKKLTNQKLINFVSGQTAEQLANQPDLIDFLRDNFYVSAEMHFTCLECLQCRTGHQHVCKNTIGKGIHEDGAYTDFMVVPANRLVLFEKDEIPPEIISFMDAIGNGVHTCQSTDVVGRNILITGAGLQGLMSCAIARQLGAAKIFVTDVVPQNKQTVDKLAIAKKLGADFTFDVGSPEGINQLKETIARETDNTGADIVFEMAGHYSAYQAALENIRMGGTMLLLGLPAGKLELDFSNQVVFKGLTIKGIYGRRVFDTWDLMRYLLANGLTETILNSGIITHQLPLSRYDEGFQALINGQAIKVLLNPGK